MDSERRRALKRQGKAEVARQSAEIRRKLAEANPAPIGDPAWAQNYKRINGRERELRETLPVITRAELAAKFLVRELDGVQQPYLGAYLRCEICGSAVPAMIRPRLFWRAQCECGNVRWLSVFRRVWVRVRDDTALTPIKLIARA